MSASRTGGAPGAVEIPAAGVTLAGDLQVPREARGIVLFAHGSGSTRRSPRNRMVAQALGQHGIATLLFDLLTPDEEAADSRTAHLRFDITLLADRLAAAAEWASNTHPGLAVGYFGASTGAAAALVAAAGREDIRAIVSRGGRPDLAGAALTSVRAPTLLIVGAADVEVLGLNQRALEHLKTDKRLEIVPGASHLFEEPGALERVADLASKWFLDHMQQGTSRPRSP